MPSAMTDATPEIVCAYATSIAPANSESRPRVFGLDSFDRLGRSFSRIGLTVIDASDIETIGDERVIALRASHFFDDRLIGALRSFPQDALLLSDGSGSDRQVVGMVGCASKLRSLLPSLRDGTCTPQQAESVGLTSVTPTDVVPAYDAKLRKHVPPFVLPADPDTTREVETRIFDAAYKGTTDFVTKWFWPTPARIVTRWCARLGIAPNTVTAVSYLLTFFSLFAFWQGDFVWGLVSAWIMTFLDTVDGKLARVTLTSSKLGDVLDHSLDMIHPPFWWAAWGAGLAGPGVLFGEFESWVAIVFLGYIAGRLLEGLFIIAFGLEMFTWRPFDMAFRLFIARRNPNLVLLTVALVMGRPDLGLISVAIWTLICIGIQIVRIAQAKIFELRGHEVTPHTG